MKETEYDFKVGEVAVLPYEYAFVSNSGQTRYEWFVRSRYVCVREDSDSQYGILVKYMGDYASPSIIVKGGEPFCKDDKTVRLEGNTYNSYRFPTTHEVKEVLGILKGNENLIGVFKSLMMEIDPSSTFWVREMESRFPFRKLFRYYDPESDKVYSSTDKNKDHCRMAVVYFHESKLKTGLGI